MLPKPPTETRPDGDDATADLLNKTSKQLPRFSNGGRFINNERSGLHRGLRVWNINSVSLLRCNLVISCIQI